MITIHDALHWGAQQLDPSLSAHLDAEILLLCSLFPPGQGETKEAIQKDRSWLWSHATDTLSQEAEKIYKQYIARRSTQEPIAYITHHKEFFGYDFYVDPRVLVPRPETEQLVDEVLKQLQACPSQPTVVIDVGTGSGCIIISILKKITEHPTTYSLQPTFYAIDISQDALEVAQINAKNYILDDQINFIQGDLLAHIIRKQILNLKSNILNLIIVANLPYVSKTEFQENQIQLQHEPHDALVADKDGIEAISKLLEQITQLTSPNIRITALLEHGYQQKDRIEEEIKKHLPKSEYTTHQDLAKLDRVTIIQT